MSTTTLQTRPLIGMEIHIQLATRTKMFCGCEVAYGQEPNSRVCPVCLGLPGALPVINRQAVRLAIRMGLALGCRIAGLTKWDRKSYYYPDLPKNYQISQYDLPIAADGRFEYEVEGQPRSVRIRRAHLEEDAGKNLHEHPQFTQVDLNRAGTALLEVVTEPDLQGAEDCYAFCIELQRLATYLEVSEGVMQKGQMRFEPNINVIITDGGSEYRTPICEVKNLNSFRAIRGAVDYEIRRHIETWRGDPGYVAEHAGRENRGWDDERSVTVYQHSKEEAHDYRYFPDPDLVPLMIDEALLAEVGDDMPELPAVRRARLVAECGLSAIDAAQIVADRATADLFDDAVRAGADPAVLGRQFISFWARYANTRACSIAALGVDAPRVAELARMTTDGRVNATAAATIAKRMLDSSDGPAAIATAGGLEQIQDSAAIEAMVEEALAANPGAADMVRNRDKKWEKSIGFLVGQVMQRSRGSAAPPVVRELLEKKLGLREA